MGNASHPHAPNELIVNRFTLVVLAVVVAGPGFAQAPADDLAGIDVRLVKARVEKDALVFTEPQLVRTAREVRVEVQKNGVTTVGKQTLVETRVVSVRRTVPLADVVATDIEGRSIPPAGLTDRLRDDRWVVLHAVPLGAEQRKLFRDGTIAIMVGPAGAAPARPVVPPPVPARKELPISLPLKRPG